MVVSMSSGRRLSGVFGWGAGVVVCPEKGVDLAGELAFEGAEGFGLAVAARALPVEVGAGLGVDAGLGDRDAVEGCVELTVAAALEPVAVSCPGGGGDGGDAGVHGERGFGAEPGDVGGFSEDLRCAERAAARQ